jgi:hypothetical protein
MKIYLTPMEALRKRERQDETQFSEFQVSTPPLMLMYFFYKIFFNLIPYMTKLKVQVQVFLSLWITMVSSKN